MKKLIWLISMMLMIAACNRKSNTGDQQVTALISPDSLTLYSSKLNSHLLPQKILLDEKTVKKALTDIKNNINNSISLVLKLDPHGGQVGIIGNLINVANWSEDSGIREFIIANDDESQTHRFTAAAELQHYLDSVMIQPVALNLTMPKDEPESSAVVTDSNSFTCLLVSNNKIYCYQGKDLTGGAFYSISGTNSFRKRLLDEISKRPVNSLQVIIKSSDESTYKNTVDVLDEMTLTKVKHYALVKISDKETEFLKTRIN